MLRLAIGAVGSWPTYDGWVTLVGWRGRIHGYSTRLYGPSPSTTALSWLGDERIAVGHLPTGVSLPTLPDQGVTHIVNCRAQAQVWLSQDLAAERILFGRSNVVHAPMWDLGQVQHPRLWSGAAVFATQALDDGAARVLIHCQQGRRRSVMLAYAVLRLRGRDAGTAARLITSHRLEAELVGVYVAGVERWLAAGAIPAPRSRRA